MTVPQIFGSIMIVRTALGIIGAVQRHATGPCVRYDRTSYEPRPYSVGIYSFLICVLFVCRGILSYCGGQDNGGDSISQLFLRIRTSCCLLKNVFYKCSNSIFKCNLFRNGCFVCVFAVHTKWFDRLISATKNFKVKTLIRELVLCVYFLPSIRRFGA